MESSVKSGTAGVLRGDPVLPGEPRPGRCTGWQRRPMLVRFPVAGGGATAPGWGQRESEGLLFKRCEIGVNACEQALQELRGHVKEAKSHREKCSNLLAAAVAAVMALQELLGSKDIDVNKEKQLQQLCTRAQSAIDQGDTKVRVYGQMGSASKLLAKVFSPNTYARFDEVITELNAVAKQVRGSRGLSGGRGWLHRLGGQAGRQAGCRRRWGISCSSEHKAPLAASSFRCIQQLTPSPLAPYAAFLCCRHGR